MLNTQYTSCVHNNGHFWVENWQMIYFIDMRNLQLVYFWRRSQPLLEHLQICRKHGGLTYLALLMSTVGDSTLGLWLKSHCAHLVLVKVTKSKWTIQKYRKLKNIKNVQVCVRKLQYLSSVLKVNSRPPEFEFDFPVPVNVASFKVSDNGSSLWLFFPFHYYFFQTSWVWRRGWRRTAAAAAADACWTELCDSGSHLEFSGDSVVTVDKLAADHPGDIKGRNELSRQAAGCLRRRARNLTASIFICAAGDLGSLATDNNYFTPSLLQNKGQMSG